MKEPTHRVDVSDVIKAYRMSGVPQYLWDLETPVWEFRGQHMLRTCVWVDSRSAIKQYYRDNCARYGLSKHNPKSRKRRKQWKLS